MGTYESGESHQKTWRRARRADGSIRKQTTSASLRYCK